MPQPGDRRTAVYLETVSRLRRLPDRPLVFGGCIDPFSLAARMVGVSEAMEMTINEPDLMRVLLEKCSTFLTAYVRAFREAGADGVIMAEPAAGLLSPPSLSQLSSAYVKQIGVEQSDALFTLILHNCAARLVHLPAILETGLDSFHFGALMDIVAALDRVPAGVVLCGNLDPTGVFVQSSPVEVTTRVTGLMKATAGRRNFVLSSGCDIPATAPLANLDAFYMSQGNSFLQDPTVRDSIQRD